ncbi:hypothetical protein DFH28DRAFT_1117505 [Melampsora americana]|nr:hypothetical protein DFH28DRAFT_1117505 [Melampsora americana]
MSRLAHLTRRNGKEKSKQSIHSNSLPSHSSGTSVQVSSNWAHTLAEPPPPEPIHRSSLHHHHHHQQHHHQHQSQTIHSSSITNSTSTSSIPSSSSSSSSTSPPHHQTQSIPSNSINRNSERQQTVYLPAGFDPFNPKLSQNLTSLPTHSNHSTTSHTSNSTGLSLCDSPASFEQPLQTVQKTRTDLLNILQDAPQHPHQKSIFQRRPSLSNSSLKSGPTSSSSRNSSASLRRQSNSTPIIALNLGLDPLNSIITHPSRPSTSTTTTSTTLSSSVASSPLLTAHLGSFHHLNHHSHLFGDSTLTQQGINLHDERSHHYQSNKFNRASGSSLTQSEQSYPPFTRRASFVNTISSGQPQDDLYDDSPRSRRPSAPNLTSPLPNDLTFKLNQTINTSTHSRSYTEFGASLETYRFGTAQLPDDLQSTSRTHSNDPYLKSQTLIRPPRRFDYDDQRYKSPSSDPCRTRRQSTLKNESQNPFPEINDLFVPFDRSAIIPTSTSYKPPSQTGSTGSDREKDAPHFVRALSTDMSLYAPSVSSLDSYSTSHHRCRTGSYSSGSTRCPLLDPNCSDSRRASDAGSIMPMRPLPTMMQSEPSQPSQTYNMYNYYNPRPNGVRHSPPTGLNRLTTTSMIPSSSMSSSTPSSSSSNGLQTGGNVFLPLRRRFLPNHLDGRTLNLKPRVETQLLGELLLALEEYVGAFGRTVKVSGSHRLGSSSTSAVTTVVAAVTVGTRSDSTEPNLLDSVINLEESRSPLIDLENEASIPNSSVDETPLPFKSELKISRNQLAEVCEELEYVTSEVVDVVPAFGEKLMQGHYGPLAVRYPSSTNSPPIPSHSNSHSNSNSNSNSRMRTAIERFIEYEPGGIKDGSDGGNGWWAERLLRDLLEGLVSESVVSNSPTSLLISNQSSNRNLTNHHHLHQADRKDLSEVEELDEIDEVDELGGIGSIGSEMIMGGSGGGGGGGGGLISKVEIDSDHRELLLDEGRKRWLAYQAHKGTR